MNTIECVESGVYPAEIQWIKKFHNEKNSRYPLGTPFWRIGFKTDDLKCKAELYECDKDLKTIRELLNALQLNSMKQIRPGMEVDLVIGTRKNYCFPGQFTNFIKGYERSISNDLPDFDFEGLFE